MDMMAREQRLMAIWTSSSVGDMLTLGMVSSTLTSNIGICNEKKPP